MKTILAASGIAALLVIGAHVQGGGESVAPPARGEAPARPIVDWTGIVRPLAAPEPATTRDAGAGEASQPLPETDVVDAHWMALTMWGEARGQGEEAMRAVGHVIDNRRRIGRHGSFATETVSEAWQFSAWNANDPNRAAMLGVLDLPRESREYRMWLAARRIADEILAGRSTDPTGGALFYHTTGVAPRWSRGVAPVAQVGTHLFFRTVR